MLSSCFQMSRKVNESRHPCFTCTLKKSHAVHPKCKCIFLRALYQHNKLILAPVPFKKLKRNKTNFKTPNHLHTLFFLLLQMKWLVGEKCHGKTKMDPAVRKPSVVRKSKNIPGKHQVLRWAELCECGIAFFWASGFLMLPFAFFSVMVERLMVTGCLLTLCCLQGENWERAAKDLGRVWMHALYKDQKIWKLFLYINYPTFFFFLPKWGWNCSEDWKYLRPHLELNSGKLCS